MSTTPAAERRDPWLGIELRHLAALAAIESEGTFSEAALSLGYVQSAVSGQVAALERLTGTCLVERSRTPGPQQLTPAGELLLGHFRHILEELDTARERLAASPQADAAGLRVAVASALPDGLVAGVLSAVMAEGGVELSDVETHDGTRLVQALRTESAEVALIDLPFHHEDIATAELARQPLVLVVQADSLLARRDRPPSLSEISGLSLVAWREGQDPSRVELELRDHGVTPHVVVRADTVEAVEGLVAVGIGAALLPGAAVASGDPRLAVLPIEDGLPDRLLGLAWLRRRSGDPRLRRFVDLACHLRERLS